MRAGYLRVSSRAENHFASAAARLDFQSLDMQRGDKMSSPPLTCKRRQTRVPGLKNHG